jgi:heme exporter protein A
MARYDAAHGPLPTETARKIGVFPALPHLRLLLLGIAAMRLSAAGLACRRGGRDVFSGVGFSVSAGEALAITGRNGAGKSSLLRMVVGLIRPLAGRLWLDGGDRELSIAEQAHYLGHQDPVKPSLSVVENLQFWAAFFGGSAFKVGETLEAVGLGAIGGLPAAYLSAGQRRRLSIARLLTVKRPIWLLDEPSSTLDTAAQTRLTEIMRSHLTEGGLILMATHGALELAGTQELSLDRANPSPESQAGAQSMTNGRRLATPNLSPQRRGEKP